MLFIIIHQAAELWMKLALHELGLAVARDPRRPPAARLQGDGAGWRGSRRS